MNYVYQVVMASVSVKSNSIQIAHICVIKSTDMLKLDIWVLEKRIDGFHFYINGYV